MEQAPVRYYEAAEPPVRAAVGGSDFLRAVSNIGQHRTIPALRLKHRFGGCGNADAAPRSPYRHLELCGIAIDLTDALKEARPDAYNDLVHNLQRKWASVY